jgi:hypothetical protein
MIFWTGNDITEANGIQAKPLSTQGSREVQDLMSYSARLRFASVVGPACERSWTRIKDFNVHKQELIALMTAEQATPVWTANGNFSITDRPKDPTDMHLSNTPKNKTWLTRLVLDTLQMQHGILSLFSAFVFHYLARGRNPRQTDTKPI